MVTMQQQLTFIATALSTIILLMLTLRLNCQPPVQSTPRKPVFINKNSDTARVERGIRAAYGQTAIYLEWQRNTERDLAGYRLFRTTEVIGGTPVNFRLYRDLPLGSQAPLGIADTVFFDANVVIGTRYYYRLRAYSRSGGESDFADSIVTYELARRATPVRPSTSVLLSRRDSSITFEWQKPLDASGFYAFKLYLFNENEVFEESDCIAVSYQISSFTTVDTLRINFNRINSQLQGETGTRVFRLLESGREYRWRVFTLPIGLERFRGASSELAGFRLTVN